MIYFLTCVLKYVHCVHMIRMNYNITASVYQSIKTEIITTLTEKNFAYSMYKLKY